MNILARACAVGLLIASCGTWAAGTLSDPPRLPDTLAAASQAALGSPEGLREMDENGVRVIKPERLLELPFGPVLVTSVRGEGADYADIGWLDIYYLRREGSGYRVLKSWPEAVGGSNHGEPPKWDVTTRFTKYPAILAHTERGIQGIYCSHSEIVELTPSGPRSSAMIDLSQKNLFPGDSDKTASEYRGRITNIVRGKSFDVSVTGTRRFTVHYVWRNGRYEALNPSSHLGCG
jgi:hypothetical protein